MSSRPPAAVSVNLRAQASASTPRTPVISDSRTFCRHSRSPSRSKSSSLPRSVLIAAAAPQKLRLVMACYFLAGSDSSNTGMPDLRNSASAHAELSREPALPQLPHAARRSRSADAERCVAAGRPGSRFRMDPRPTVLQRRALEFLETKPPGSVVSAETG